MHADTTTRTPPTSSANLGFGRVFTEHMLRMDYSADRGWGPGEVVPYAPVTLDPAASALHYGQTVFEGLKAFHGADGLIRLFRPEMHARRFQRSCEQLCMPTVPVERFMHAVETLVRRDAAWVPRDDVGSLYIRPFAYATEAFLGVRPAVEYTFVVILSPVGAYYAKGFAPVRIWIEREAVRAARGGLGGAKTGANYAASLKAAARAKERGYDQVLWTDACEHAWVEEVGTMNLFVRFANEVVTPPLGGSILAGVTRDSVMHLLRARGVKVTERPLSVGEIVEAHAKGTLREVFGTGTAAVISPVGALGMQGEDLVIGDGGVGELAGSLYKEIVAIQRGNVPDDHGWTRPIRG